ncbi:hypothetical protein H4R18_003841 [Coemansia javaensis]|uniref:Uncharacterized protein n=1 Tax=Coemansia javaensis TaxID=2761396 RepID=A0A9W8H6M4_9FUNG|nr:hypothetical protein H4R18_003841 [Coemansia javaensis]
MCNVRRPVEDNWKQALPVLAVCRQWRRIGVPLVGRHSYIVYGDRSVLVRNPEAAAAAAAASVRARTNLGLLAATGAYRQVRTELRLRAFYAGEPFDALEAMLAAARQARGRWDNVTSLNINLSPQPRQPHSAQTADEHRARRVAIVAQFGAVFPAVAELSIDGPYRNEHTAPLYVALARLYSGQLRALSTLPLVPASTMRFTAALTSLEIGAASGPAHRLPRVLAESLEELALYCIPTDYAWTAHDGDCPGRVTFGRLRRLWAFYGSWRAVPAEAGAPKAQPPPVLAFPALQTLHCTSDEGPAPLLGTARLPAAMRRVVVRGPLETLQCALAARLPGADGLTVSLAHSGRCSMDAVAATVNAIFRGARADTRCELLLDERNIEFRPQDIVCPGLARLRVAAPITAAAALAAVRRFPRLESLALTDVVPHPLPAEIPAATTTTSVAGADDNALLASGASRPTVPPLAPRLEALCLQYQPQLHPPEDMLAVAQYLLLCAPALRRTMLRNMPGHLFAPLFERCQADYPHLGRIQMF